jgi:sugar phosphate isomerase/epimerase
MIFEDASTPAKWVKAVEKMGYRAAYCPIDATADAGTVAAYRRAASESDIVIAEVGAWGNPLSPDPAVAAKAMEHCKRQLDLAERIGALCCVNIAGSCGDVWDGPHRDNLKKETFDRIVADTQAIIDAVSPAHATYSLEPMPWIFPTSPDSYLELMKAVDRKGFGVHLDPVNMINSPERYINNAAFLEDCFDKLGDYILSVHAKDITLSDKLTTHLDEARPGDGDLCYRTFLDRMNRLHPDTPFMLEHMTQEADYRIASEYVRKVGAELGLSI